MFIHPLNHQMSAEHLQCAQFCTSATGLGMGSARSYGTVPVSKGLGKHLSTIKRPATVTQNNMDESQRWYSDPR